MYREGRVETRKDGVVRTRDATADRPTDAGVGGLRRSRMSLRFNRVSADIIAPSGNLCY